MSDPATTPVDSANLILKLYELRREPLLRQARSWFVGEFNPETFEELLEIVHGPKNPWFRMVVGYWDMAASLVISGAIDSKMFRDTSGEIVATFSKVEPYLAELREATGSPDFLKNMENLVREIPGSEARMNLVRERLRATAKENAVASEAAS